MIAAGTIIAILFLHIWMHAIEVGFGEPSPQCVNDPNPLCGTPVAGFFELGREKAREDQGFLGRTVGRLPGISELGRVWDVVQASWSALVGIFTFNYAWVKSDSYIARLILFVVQAVLASIAISWLIYIGVASRR